MNPEILWGGFDVESTAPDPETARIVQACVGKGLATGEWHPQIWLLNPGVPIPPEATEIHGITDEQVAGCPPVAEKARQIALSLMEVWGHGGAAAVFNAPYDFTVLDRELRRAGTSFTATRVWGHGLVVDPLVLDKAVDRYRRGSRRLADTCAVYGIDIGNAHDAAADTFATVRLAWRIINSDPRLRRMTAEELHEFQQEAYRRERVRFIAYRESIGDPITDANTDWPMRPYREVV